jgi:hypothetical protein
MKPAGSWQAYWLPRRRFSFNLRIIQETPRFIRYDSLSEEVQMIICHVKELTTGPYMIIALSSISILSIMCWHAWSTVRLQLVIVWLRSKFQLRSCSQVTNKSTTSCTCLTVSSFYDTADHLLLRLSHMIQLPFLIFSVEGTIWCYSSTSGDPFLHSEDF